METLSPMPVKPEENVAIKKWREKKEKRKKKERKRKKERGRSDVLW